MSDSAFLHGTKKRSKPPVDPTQHVQGEGDEDLPSPQSTELSHGQDEPLEGGLLSFLFGKKKAPDNSGPKSGHAMTPKEMGSALSAREVIEATEQAKVMTAKKEKEEGRARIDDMLKTKVAHAAALARNVHLSEGEMDNLISDPKGARGVDKQKTANPDWDADATKKPFRIKPGRWLSILKDDGEKSGSGYKFNEGASLTLALTPQTVGGSDGYALTFQGAKCWVAEEDADLGAWKEEAANSSLFGPKGPARSDVKQGGLGDCYLEAAISALADKDPAFVKDMFVDYGDKVGIKLFDIDESDPSAPKFSRREVVVEKSRAKAAGEDLYDQGALWVALLEKAYAAARFAGNAAKEPAHQARDAAAMSMIAGGSPSHAGAHLTGRPPKIVRISSGAGRDFAAAGLPWNDQQVAAWKQASTSGGDYSSLVIHGLLSDSHWGKLGPDKVKKMTDSYFTWLDKNRSGLLAIYEKAGAKPGQDPKAYRGEIRLEELETFFGKGGLNLYYWTVMQPHLATLFPGKRGSGSYSAAQEDAWQTITAGLGAKKIVALGTHKSPVRGKGEGVGHSGGEAKGKGLAGGHAYTILDFRTSDKNPDVREVLVRNPWGKFGRAYDDNGKAISEAEGNGEFWLKLADVTKRFFGVYVV